MSTRFDRWSRDGMPSDSELARINRGISSTMSGVLRDAHVGISKSASMIPDSQREEQPRPASGGSVPLRGVDTRWVDAQLDAQDRVDRIALVRQAMETAEIERRLSQAAHDPYRAKTSYNPLQAYDESVASCHRDKKQK